MSKTIGEILKELRKANGMTQEQVAEALNVSFQSISRWENSLSYPDVMLIPIIARLFDVSTDTLFDVDTTDCERMWDRYEQQYKEHRKNGNLAACRDEMQEALEQFPRDHHFMMNLAESLQHFEGGSAAERADHADGQYAVRIRLLCERVLEDCKKEQERLRATLLLCKHYAASGNTNEAVQLANGVADFEHCREVLFGEILIGDEKRHQLQETMLKAVDYVATTLVNTAFRKDYGMTDVLTLDERIAYVNTANELYALLMPDENYQFFHRIVGWNHRRLCELYLLKGDVDAAFEELLKAEQHATAFDTLTDHHYTAPFVNALVYDPTEHAKCWQGSERGMLLYRLGELSAYFENHNGFAKMKARLETATADEVSVSVE